MLLSEKQKEQLEQEAEISWQKRKNSLLTIGIQYLAIRARHPERARFRVLFQPNRNRVLTLAVDRAGRRVVRDARMTIPLKPNSKIKPRVLHFMIDSKGRVLPEQIVRLLQAA